MPIRSSRPPPGEQGLIQLISALPLAAPNHSVLSEDLGEIVSLDGCPCGRRGTSFVFRGRAPRSETRGCSDVVRRELAHKPSSMSSNFAEALAGLRGVVSANRAGLCVTA